MRGSWVQKLPSIREKGASCGYERRKGCYVQTFARDDVADLTTDWLDKLGASWQVQDMDILLIGTGFNDVDHNRLSRESLESAARAVIRAHIEAKMICSLLGKDVEDVTRIVEAFIEDPSSDFHNMDGVSEAAAGRLEHLHHAGLLHTLRSKATVEYFRTKAAREDFKLIQDHFKELLGRHEPARVARGATAKKAREEEGALAVATKLREEEEDEMLATTGVPTLSQMDRLIPNVVSHLPSDVERCCDIWETMDAKQQQRVSLCPKPTDSLRSFLLESCSLKGVIIMSGGVPDKVKQIL